MSNNHSTAEGEPLHTATLLAVLAKLRDRLTAIPALVDDDTADHPLTHVELAGWEARVEALEAFAADVDPSDVIHSLSGGTGGWIWSPQNSIVLRDPKRATGYALAILAAVEFAGGAK